MFSPTRLQGPIVIDPAVWNDRRGFFLESYRQDRYTAAGIDVEFVQDNHSRSRGATVRGLHFQTSPGQPKLVRAARGRVFDVVVDLRRSSPTFGEWESFELDDVNHRQLFVPVGFAHGFAALSDVVDVVYKVGSYYDPDAERGVLWNDPDIGIEWPLVDPSLSDRDRVNPTLASIRDYLPPW